jgi:hypothetical protein
MSAAAGEPRNAMETATPDTQPAAEERTEDTVEFEILDVDLAIKAAITEGANPLRTADEHRLMRYRDDVGSVIAARRAAIDAGR